MSMQFDGITTKRCCIREITLDDIDALFALYDKPHMTDYIEPLYEKDAEIAYRKAYIDNVYRVFGYGMWGVFYRENDELIGMCGVEYRGEGSFDTADIGYVIAPEYRGRGICIEALEAILDYVKVNTGLAVIRAKIRDSNEPSVRVANRLHFTPTDEIDEGERIYLYRIRQED